MDYPLSRADELDLLGGKFTDGEPGVTPASIIPAETMNAIIDELKAVIVAGGLAPDEVTFTQVRDAITAMIRTYPVAIAVINVAGGANVVLTEEQWRADILVFVGALTGNIAVTVPAAADQWIAANRTSGNYLLTLKTAAGTGVLIPQGENTQAFCDAVNVGLSVTDKTDDAFSFFMGNIT